jgi:hypothetical protein
MVKLTGRVPISFSNENNLVPIASAIKALQQKKAVNPRNSLVGRSLRMLWIISEKVLIVLLEKEN